VRRALVWTVGLVYAVAWFVQVIKDGDTLAGGGLPGWQALHVALSPLWGDFDGNVLQGTLSVASGLTNLVFVAAFVRLVRGQPLTTQRWCWMLFASAALNLFWIIDMAPPGDMRAGYWLWLASFALLGFVARLNPAAPRAAA
jgi:hypothetical protein